MSDEKEGVATNLLSILVRLAEVRTSSPTLGATCPDLQGQYEWGDRGERLPEGDG